MFDKGWQPKEYKGINDEIRQQQMKTKDMDAKGKLQYFWDYYKIHTIAVILALAAVIVLIRDIRSAKDYNFYAVMLNSTLLDGNALQEDFGRYAGLDMENYECYIDTLSSLSYQSSTQMDMSTMQKLVALIQTGDIDVMVLDGQVFYNYALNEVFYDLRDILSPEELAVYEDKLYYVDRAQIKASNEYDGMELPEDASDALKAIFAARNAVTSEDMAAEALLHADPGSMEEPIPVGIYIGSSPLVQKTGCYGELIPIVGFSATGKRVDTAKKYLSYLWDESIPFDKMVSMY